MAGMIVGRRMRGWKRTKLGWLNGHRHLFCWFEVEHADLHSTKGWRVVKRFKVWKSEHDQEWIRAPAYQEFFVPDPHAGGLHLKKGPSDSGRWMRGRTPDACPVRLSVHDWWRRQRFGSSARLTRMEASDEAV